LTVSVLASEADTPLAVFLFKCAKPAWMMVDESVRMRGDEGFPAGVRIKISLDDP
jgi:hypothetical protein